MRPGERRKTLARLKRFLKQRDLDEIDEGAVLLESLGDPEIFDGLLDGVTVQNGALVPNKTFSGSGPAQTWLNYALLRVLAGAPADYERARELREAVTRFGFCTRERAKCPLPGALDLRYLDALPNLERLSLFYCTGLTDLTPIAGRTGLVELDLSSCLELTDLTPIAGLTELTWLGVGGHLTTAGPVYTTQRLNLKPLAVMAKLRALDVSYAKGLRSLAGIEGLTGLTSLTLDGCQALGDLTPLAGLTALAELGLNLNSQNKALKTLDGIQGAAGVSELKISAGGLLDISALAEMPGLRSLSLNLPRFAGSLDPLARMSGLTALRLEGGMTLQSADFARGMSALTELTLRHATPLSDLSGLSGCVSMESLHLEAWHAIDEDGFGFTDLSGLSGCLALKSLRISGASSLVDVSGLSGLSGLTNLRLYDCELLTDLTPLSELGGLELLELRGAKALRDVDALADLVWLRRLDLHGCEALEQIHGIRNMTALAEISLYETPMASRNPWSYHHMGEKVQALRAEVFQEWLQERALRTGQWTAASLRLMLAHEDPDQREQGLELMRAMGDPALFAEVMAGCEVSADTGELTVPFGSQNGQVLQALLEGPAEDPGWRADRGLDALERIWIEAPGLADLSALEGLSALREVHCRGCESLEDISALDVLPALSAVTFDRCPRVDYEPLAGLSGLRSLSIADWARKKMPALPPGLTSLWAPGQRLKLEALSGLSGLESLHVGLIEGLTDAAPLAALPRICAIRLGMARELTDLTALASAPQLEALALGDAWALTSLAGLEELERLTRLEIQRAKALGDASPLAGLTNLRALKLPGAGPIAGLTQALAGMSQLTELSLSGQSIGSDLRALAAAHPAMVHLALVRSPSLISLDGIESMPALETLDVQYCEALRDSYAFVGAGGVTSLDLSACYALECPPDYQLVEDTEEWDNTGRYRTKLLKHRKRALREATSALKKLLKTRDMDRILPGVRELAEGASRPTAEGLIAPITVGADGAPALNAPWNGPKVATPWHLAALLVFLDASASAGLDAAAALQGQIRSLTFCPGRTRLPRLDLAAAALPPGLARLDLRNIQEIAGLDGVDATEVLVDPGD